MRPVTLDFIGIKSYSERAYIDFSQLTADGLFGVFGDTGSGKSTILDAIFYALYGKFPEKINIEEFINRKAGGMRIDFTFSLKENGKDVTYKVHREQKLRTDGMKSQPAAKATLSVVDGGEQFPVADNVSAVNDKIVDLLGLTLEQFMKCIVLPQGEFAAFLSMGRADRLKIVTALFDIEKYGFKLNAKLSAETKAIEEKAARKKGALDGYEAYTERLLKQSENDVEAAKKAFEDYSVIYSKIAENFDNFKLNYDRHKKVLDLLKRKKTLDERSEEFAKKNLLFNNFFAAESAVETERKLSQKILEKRKAEGEISVLDERLEQLKSRQEQLKKSIDLLDGKREVCSAYKNAYDRLNALLPDFNGVAAKQKERTRLLGEYKKYAVERDTIARSKDAAEVELRDVEKQISDFSFRNKLSSCVDRLAVSAKGKFIEEEVVFLESLSDLSGDFQVIAAIRKRIASLIAFLPKDNKDDIDFDGVLSTLKNILKENDVLQRSLSDKKDELAAINKKLDDLVVTLNKITDEGKSLKSQIDEFDEKWKSAVAECYEKTKSELGKEFSECIARAKCFYDHISEEIQATESGYEKALSELSDKQKERELAAVRLESIVKETAALEAELKDKLGNMTITYAKEIVAAVDDYGVLKSQIERYNTEKSKVEDALKELESQMTEDDYSDEALELKKKERSDAEDKKQFLYKNYIKLQNEYENVSQNYAQRCIIEKEYLQVLKEKAVYDKLSAVLKGNKFTAYIADEYLSEICFDAERTLSELSSGRYGLRYDGDFYVIDNLSGGESRKTNTVSGGELFLVSLSLALSLSSSIIAKSNKPIEFFFLDEGFGSLDSGLVEIVLDSLEKLKSANFTIGLISHVEALKERINAKITVSAPNAVKGSSITVTV